MPNENRELYERDQGVDKLLSAVREQQNLDTNDQAAEWLLRQHLRKAAMQLTGRGRALYLIRQNQ